MLAFAYYLLKITICAAVLFIYYWFLLRNKVFHAYNRFYLLAVVGISMLLPLFSINIFHKQETRKTSVIKMLTVVTESDDYMGEVIIQAKPASSFSSMSILPFFFLLVSTVLLFLLLQMLIKIFMLFKSNESKRIENILFVNTDAAKGTPFSFFNSIFWNKQISLQSTAGARIFKHELAHIQQRHSYDKLFMNIVLIIFWANPVYWIIRKELSMIHEFIADKMAVEDGDTTAFAAMILATTYPNHTMTITNNFFYSPIKRRLMMLTKNQHPKINYLSRLLVLPLAVILFAAFTLKAREYKTKQSEITYTSNNINQQTGIVQFNSANSNAAQKNKTFANDEPNLQTDKQITVVLDAGHGGKDGGAKSEDGIFEKDVALQLVKKIKAQNNNPNIHFVLLRETDVFYDVKEKAILANEIKPDLFISVHLDGAPYKSNNNGLSVYVPNDSLPNSAKSKILASSVIGAFENNYGLVVPKTMTERRTGLYVLKAVEAPSIFIEAGYITNKKDAAYLLSDRGQETFANNVLLAINNFAKSNDFLANNYNQANEAVKPLDEIVALSNYNTNIKEKAGNSQFGDTVLFKGKKIKRYSVNVDAIKRKNGAVTLYFSDNTSTVITAQEAEKIGIPMPEPFSKVTANNKTKSPDTNILSGGNKQDNRTLVFSKTETQPAFPDGLAGWKKFLMQNVNAMVPVNENWATGTYNILVKFIVEKDGSLSNINTGNYIGSKTAQHCIDVIKNGPKWIPAKQNGKAVAAHFTQPITFVIAGDEDSKKVVQNIDPVFRIGNFTSARAKVEEFKKQKFATVTDGYEFVSCNVYFAGIGFSKVGVAKMVGNDFTQLNSYLDKCAPGTNIIFNNIWVKNASGLRVIEDKSYSLF